LPDSTLIAVRRVTPEDRPAADAAFALIEEYYEAIGVVVRDDRAALEHYLADSESSIWIASVGPSVRGRQRRSVAALPASVSGDSLTGDPVGCVMLRPLPQIAEADEVKRLYVRPAQRSLGVAHALMQAAEEHARQQERQWLYLDTKDDLTPAIRFYLSTGYEHCPRYNDNPQATIFLRKRL
jgi:GNAT superfamily N-acetyltransferase